MVYACDRCHFVFERKTIPDACPDCGSKQIRTANSEEIRQYTLYQKEQEERYMKKL